MSSRPLVERRGQRLGLAGHADDAAEHADHLQDPGDAALVEGEHRIAALHQLGGDARPGDPRTPGSGRGPAPRSSRSAREERRHLRLLPRLGRPHRVAGDADDAVAFAQQVQRLGRLLGEADDPLRERGPLAIADEGRDQADAGGGGEHAEDEAGARGGAENGDELLHVALDQPRVAAQAGGRDDAVPCRSRTVPKTATGCAGPDVPLRPVCSSPGSRRRESRRRRRCDTTRRHRPTDRAARLADVVTAGEPRSRAHNAGRRRRDPNCDPASLVGLVADPARPAAGSCPTASGCRGGQRHALEVRGGRPAPAAAGLLGDLVAVGHAVGAIERRLERRALRMDPAPTSTAPRPSAGRTPATPLAIACRSRHDPHRRFEQARRPAQPIRPAMAATPSVSTGAAP